MIALIWKNGALYCRGLNCLCIPKYAQNISAHHKRDGDGVCYTYGHELYPRVEYIILVYIHLPFCMHRYTENDRSRIIIIIVGWIIMISFPSGRCMISSCIQYWTNEMKIHLFLSESMANFWHLQTWLYDFPIRSRIKLFIISCWFGGCVQHFSAYTPSKTTRSVKWILANRQRLYINVTVWQHKRYCLLIVWNWTDFVFWLKTKNGKIH